ncbi:saccharopine dehydrogenase-like oxidoreductase [Stylophora pistillata]|uniref:saccharopine dehydrogenase-like oxidoreductase n=1 Tax=Stylophora pistillata TaxID=50429 RepID=UPI000C03F0CC|nr:saccharopine dehydrogenase-like oxidoreductase [Stylophora pistillata]
MATSDKEFAIVVFGASGFTGQFVVREVAKNCKGKFKWAVAGRSKDKLEKVLQETASELGQYVGDVGVMVANCSDEASLSTMCSSAKIVLNCVGPYRFYGEPVVKAAVENGCHHLDISGEPEFLETMQHKYHDKAVCAGVHVVGTCGFDSIPADMGVVFTQESFPGELCHLESFLTLHSGPKGSKGHYGTYQSIIYGIASDREGNLKKLRKELFPTPMPKFGPKLARRFVTFVILLMGITYGYKYRFYGEPVVKAAVENGCHHLDISGEPEFSQHPKFFSCGFFSHEGPTREQVRCLITYVAAENGYNKAGYVATPICMVQAAMVILEETLPNSGGVLTPAAAFTGTSLIDRLNENGVMFSVLSCKESEK